VCGERGNATADAASFTGWIERFIIGDQGLGADPGICAVRFDVKRVGQAPAGCTACAWTDLIEYSNPQVEADERGVCAKSDLALDSVAIAKVVGTREAIGFALHYQGALQGVRFKYYEETQSWDTSGNASWDSTSKAFKFNDRSGFCNYGP
jgi:hypothetical protein